MLPVLKRSILIITCLCLTVLCCCPAGATHPLPISANGTTPSQTEADIGNQIATIMQAYFDDPESAKAALLAIDVTLLDEPRLVSHQSETERALDPTDYTLTVYSAQRAGSKNTYLMWSIHANKNEWLPGPLDYVSIEWDTQYASYHSSTGDGEFSTVQGRSDGIVLFNVQDQDLDKDDYTYGYVIVSPKKSGWMEYGSKFVHTYTKYIIGGSASASFAPSVSIGANGEASLNLEYTMGFTVTLGVNTGQWQLWDDNAVDLN